MSNYFYLNLVIFIVVLSVFIIFAFIKYKKISNKTSTVSTEDLLNNKKQFVIRCLGFNPEECSSQVLKQKLSTKYNVCIYHYTLYNYLISNDYIDGVSGIYDLFINITEYEKIQFKYH